MNLSTASTAAAAAASITANVSTTTADVVVVERGRGVMSSSTTARRRALSLCVLLPVRRLPLGRPNAHGGVVRGTGQHVRVPRIPADAVDRPPVALQH